ncbi:MAG: hypothetical protein Kow0077_13540 [Anaerolineae bacterium]
MTLMSLFRPLTPREMVRWTFQTYARHFSQWLLIGLLAVVPLVAVNLILAQVLPQPAFDAALLEQFLAPLERGEMLNNPALQQQLMDDLIQNSLILLVTVLAQLLAQIVIIGTVAGGAGAVMTAAAYRDEPVSAGEGLQALQTRFSQLAGGHILAGLLLIGLMTASILGTMICIGFFGMGLTIYVYLALVPLAAPALALGKGDISTALREAWQFGKQRVWLIFWATLGLYGLRTLVGLPLDALQMLLAPDSLLAAQVIGVVVELLILPVGVIFFTLLYEDTRGQAATPLVDDLNGISPAAVGPAPLLSMADLPNIMGIAMLSVGALLALYLVTALQAMLFMGG